MDWLSRFPSEPFHVARAVCFSLFCLYWADTSLARQLPQEVLDQLPPEAREMAQSQMDSYGQAFEEEERQPQFSSEEFRTRPLVLEETAKDIVVDIEILRWGEVENQQSFTISLQSQPGFVDNIRLDKTQISLSPEEWAEELQLAFDVKEGASGSE